MQCIAFMERVFSPITIVNAVNVFFYVFVIWTNWAGDFLVPVLQREKPGDRKVTMVPASHGYQMMELYLNPE